MKGVNVPKNKVSTVAMLAKLLATMLVKTSGLVRVLVSRDENITGLQKTQTMQSFEVAYKQSLDVLADLGIVVQRSDTKVEILWEKIEEL